MRDASSAERYGGIRATFPAIEGETYLAPRLLVDWHTPSAYHYPVVLSAELTIDDPSEDLVELALVEERAVEIVLSRDGVGTETTTAILVEPPRADEESPECVFNVHLTHESALFSSEDPATDERSDHSAPEWVSDDMIEAALKGEDGRPSLEVFAPDGWELPVARVDVDTDENGIATPTAVEVKPTGDVPDIFEAYRKSSATNSQMVLTLPSGRVFYAEGNLDNDHEYGYGSPLSEISTLRYDLYSVIEKVTSRPPGGGDIFEETGEAECNPSYNYTFTRLEGPSEEWEIDPDAGTIVKNPYSGEFAFSPPVFEEKERSTSSDVQSNGGYPGD